MSTSSRWAEPAAVERPHAAAVTAARGFRAAGVHAGIRKKRLDLALVTSEQADSAAAVFTRNLAAAAPVLVSREHLRVSGGTARAIVVNAGNANACTGDAGLDAARRTTAAVADLLHLPVHEVLVASTGVIGQPYDSRTGRLYVTGKLWPRLFQIELVPPPGR